MEGCCTDVVVFVALVVYVGCLQGFDLDYSNGSCNGFISTGDKIWGEIGWESWYDLDGADVILVSFVIFILFFFFY